MLVALGSVAAVRAEHELAGLAPDQLGPYTGWVVVATDPQPAAGATRLVVEIEGERFEAWVRGRVRSLRAQTFRTGDVVAVSGERVELDADRAGRLRSQHVVGEMRADWWGDVRPGVGAGPLGQPGARG